MACSQGVRGCSPGGLRNPPNVPTSSSLESASDLLWPKELIRCDQVKDFKTGRLSWTIWVDTKCHPRARVERGGEGLPAGGAGDPEATCRSAGSENGGRGRTGQARVLPWSRCGTAALLTP